MKSLTIFAATLALMAATAVESRAQGNWNMPASGCVVQTANHAAAYFNAVYGTVDFAPKKYGDIKLTCPIPFLSYQTYLNGQPNQMVITYYNDNGFVGGINHCYIAADLLRSNTNNQEAGGDLSSLNTANTLTSGRQTLGAGLSEQMDFLNNYYWVDIQLHRDAPNAACNPTLVGVYLNQIIF
jgi:hypothetical protein